VATTPLRDQSVTELIASIASAPPSPGAGTAAGILLALAAACAHKALAITRKHRPLSAADKNAGARLTEVIDQALEGAGRDALCFEAFVQHKDEATANALLDSDRSAQEVGNLLGEELGEIEGVIHPIAGGDLASARILLAAAREVQDLIAAENQRAAADIT
jgi:hypothetical protein